MSLLSNVASKSADESDVPPESSDDEGWTGQTCRQPNLDDEYERHMYDLLENSASRQVLRRALAVIRYIERDRRLSDGRLERISRADYSFSDRTETGDALLQYIIQTLKPRFQAELADLEAAHDALVDSDSDSDASTVVDEEESRTRPRPENDSGESKAPPSKKTRF